MGADALSQSLRDGTLVTLPAITSLAKTLGANKIAEKVFDACHNELGPAKLVRSLTVEDDEAITACFQFAKDHGILVEPACGASLAALYYHHVEHFTPEETRIVVEICGGATFNSIETLTAYANKLGINANEVVN